MRIFQLFIFKQKDGKVPYITRTNLNNGIENFIGEEQLKHFKKNEGNVITIGLDTQTVFYQEVPFYTGQNIQVLSNSNLNEHNAKFVIPILEKQMTKFNWGGNGATLTRLKRTKITLPIDDNQNPDWHYMELYIKNKCVLQDSDYPTQAAVKNLKMIEELREQGVKAYLTRRREPENYLHPDCFEFEIKIDHYSDVKKHVNDQDKKIARSKVLEIYWPKMTYENIRETERYTDEFGNERFEFTEMIKDFLSLVQTSSLVH